MLKRLIGIIILGFFVTPFTGIGPAADTLAAEQKLYSVHIIKGSTGTVYELDPADGKTLGSKNISLSRSNVFGAFGLAADPTTGLLYTILVIDGLAFDAGSKRVLATLDPETGQASKIGVIGQGLRPIRSLAIDGEGILYGATSTNTSELVEIDKQNGTIKKVLISLHSSGGPLDTAIAFNPDENTIYNVTGGGIIEKIKLPSLDKTTQSTTGTNYGNAKALVYCGAFSGCPAGSFRLTANTAPMDASGDLWHEMNSNGNVGPSIRKLDHSTKGLAFFPPVASTKGVVGDFDGD
ncbi:MAG TPA: hypothetical protein VKN76_12180, partial [Kiloniellaceae bacterium]|nr:hypothetical protein [Kiloniellaceae bacterium]